MTGNSRRLPVLDGFARGHGRHAWASARTPGHEPSGKVRKVVEVAVKRRDEDQGQERAGDHSPGYYGSDRRTRLSPWPGPEQNRQHAAHQCGRRHQNWAETDRPGTNQCVASGQPFLGSQGVGVVNQQDRVLADQTGKHDDADQAKDIQGLIKDIQTTKCPNHCQWQRCQHDERRQIRVV